MVVWALERRSRGALTFNKDLRRGRGTPMMTWMEGIPKDMMRVGLQSYLAFDRNAWRRD